MRTAYKIPEIAEKRIEENKCPACGKPKEEWDRRKDWRCCSADCSRNYFKSTIYWADIRRKVLERDNHTCVICRAKDNEKEWINTHYIKTENGWTENKAFELITLEVDHIIPVALGGDQFDMNNCRTLCEKCHKKKTKKDVQKIAEKRREKKEKEEIKKIQKRHKSITDYLIESVK